MVLPHLGQDELQTLKKMEIDASKTAAKKGGAQQKGGDQSSRKQKNAPGKSKSRGKSASRL